MTGPLPAGQCVCDRPIPDQSPSDWACSEVCQAAWLHHQADPDYPHPRDIRNAMEQNLRTATDRNRARRARLPDEPAIAAPPVVAQGTEIAVDGHQFVRVGSHWQPAGMWTPVAGRFEGAAYRRWCPNCQARVASLLYPASDRQECATCGQSWPGRPLLGWVEERGEPWPAVRLLLSDAQRSATRTLTAQAVNQVIDRLGAVGAEQWLGQWWLRLERQLCGGYADQDRPDDRQRRRQRLSLDRSWHLHVDV